MRLESAWAPFHHLHIDRIMMNGNLTLDIESGRTQEVPLVAECYWQGIARRVERREQAGLPVPDSLNLKPTVEVDIDD